MEKYFVTHHNQKIIRINKLKYVGDNDSHFDNDSHWTTEF